MPKIATMPAVGKRIFRRIRRRLGWVHFGHFWRLAVAIACMPGRRNLRRIHTMCGGWRTRQAMAHFLNEACWPEDETLRDSAHETLRRLGYQAGDDLYVILDDTQKRKRGKVMAAVSKLFLHAEKVYAPGHTILGVCLYYRGVIIPYAVRLWASRDCCRRSHGERRPEDRLDFVKLTELGAYILEELTLPGDGRAIVLFDSYYLCSVVVGACRRRGWPFLSMAKKNRNFSPDGRGREKRKLNSYGANVLRRRGTWQKIHDKKHRVADRLGRLSKAGEVKLVFSRRAGEATWVTLACSELNWDAATILGHYYQRWPIELLFKMSKQYLGLGDYQMLRYRGVVRYLHLVLIAYLLLTHLAFDEPDVQAQRQGKGLLRLPSIPHLQQKLRTRLWDDMFKRLQRGKKQAPIVKKIRNAMVV